MVGTGFPARLRMSHQSRRETNVRRRNGKLQSCEPCRKGKLRCDHMMPTCGRCARRNKPEQCIYHPAPLTKTATLPTPQVSESTSSPPSLVPSLENDVASLTTLPFPPFEEAPPQARVPRANSLPAQTWSSNHGPQNIEDLRRPPLPDNQVRGDTMNFIGATGFISHHAVLAENELNIGILPPRSECRRAADIPQSHIDKGALVLSMLKDLPLYEKYIEKWFSLTRGVVIIEPMLKMWTSGVWTSWHRALESQKHDRLQEVSIKVWENTMNPLSRLLNRHTTPREFISNTTGEGLRWEVVGIVLTLVGLLAQTLQDGDPIFCSHDDPPVDRVALALKAFNASVACVTFCVDFDVMNDLFLWVLYENSILSNSLHATGSFFNFQKSGQLYSALIAFGLHEEIKVDNHTPFFISELRKRIFICAYENDKYTAAFIGRPPRLTRQYCLIQLPLDLNDAQTMSDGLDLENAMASLDSDGWNQSGVVQRCTFARIFASNALITEEILEISLGLQSNEETIRRAADIEERAVQLWDNLPSFLKTDKQHPWDTKRAPAELLFLAHIRLANLGHHFLLQRTLIKKIGADSTKLLAVSRETFEIVLLVMQNRDLLREYQLDLAQLLCMNGIPAAAVVAVELLHQEEDPSSLSALTNPLPRSETIQDLSVLVSCLGSVRRETSGYAICERGKKFLKKILDTILDPTSSRTVRSNSSLDGLGDTSLTMPLFQTGSDGDFVRWLESMEWEQQSWVNFN